MTKMPEVTDGVSIHRPRRRPQPEEGPLVHHLRRRVDHRPRQAAGIVVHPTYKNSSGTLLNAVLWRVRDRADAQPGILTRLDKDTSGLVVMALTPEVHAAMQTRRAPPAGSARNTSRSCADRRSPRSGRIALPLGRDPADRRRVVVTPDGARERDALRGDRRRCGRHVARALRARHRTHAPDPRAPGLARLADRRRRALRTAGRSDRAPGAACLARLAAPSRHAAAARVSKRRCPTTCAHRLCMADLIALARQNFTL